MDTKRHPLQSMCSYLGCFPPTVPASILTRYVPPDAMVLDPFCGSGTTLFEAVRAGHRCVGVDLNPLAVALATAKLEPVSLEQVVARLFEIASGYRGEEIDHLTDSIRLIYHPRTLAQLVYLRDALDLSRAEDRFLRGVVLGIMHGKWRKDQRSTAYLSIDMPNTFSMSPEYVRKFVKKNRLRQLPIDVFGKLRDRAKWLLREGPAPAYPRSWVLQGDATKLPAVLDQIAIERVDAIVTSPPYLGVLRYGAFNWIRLWFLGHEPAVIDRLLDGTDSLDRYLSFITSFLSSAASVLKPGGIAALVIGDVKEWGTQVKLAERVWDELCGLVPFRCISVDVDRFDATTKTTRIWGDDKKGRATPLDRVLVLEREAPKRKRSTRILRAETTAAARIARRGSRTRRL
jgi:SAM-dependent methyltransferase